MILAWRRSYPELLEEGFLDLERRANQAIREVATENSVPMVDAAARIPGGSANFADLVQFTDKGAEIMAGLYAPTVEQAPRREKALPRPCA